MSIKLKFMEMLQTLQQPDSFEYDVVSNLKNIDFNASISNIVHSIDVADNTESNIIKSRLLELQHIYIEFESETQKMCSLNYTRCIQCAASSEELQAIIYELWQYEELFGKLSLNWRNAFDYLASVLDYTNSNNKHIFEKLCNPIKEMIDVIGSSLKLYLKNADSKLEELEEIVCMSASFSEDYNARESHHSQIHYSPRCEHEHYHLSAADRKELQHLMSLSHSASFKSLLFEYIDEIGMTYAQVYKAAGISKQVFSYIRNGKQHTLKKENVVSICIVLHLSTEKALKLLASCGYWLSEYNTFDRIINFCISKGCYDVDEINDLLVEYNQQTICGI